MPTSRRRQQTADILGVLADVVRQVSEEACAACPTPKKRRLQHGRRRKLRPSPALPTAVLATILHNAALDTHDRCITRLVHPEWRAAHDSNITSIVCHTIPTNLPFVFPILRRLDLSYIDHKLTNGINDCTNETFLEWVLKTLTPSLPLLQRLVVTYGQLGGREEATGRDRVELVQVGFRSTPARIAEYLGSLLAPLTQLQDLLVYRHEDNGYPSTLAIYHRYPACCFPPADPLPPSTHPSSSCLPALPLSTPIPTPNNPPFSLATPPCSQPTPAPINPTPGPQDPCPSSTPATALPLRTTAAAAATASPRHPPASTRPTSRHGCIEPLAAEPQGACSSTSAGPCPYPCTSTATSTPTSSSTSYSPKWLSHLGVLLPPNIGCYAASCIHLHTAPQCQNYLTAGDLLYSPVEEVAALPPRVWQASRGWCTLRLLDLNYCTISSWPTEWLTLPLLHYFNLSPYNTAAHLPLPNLTFAPATPLRALAVRSTSAAPLLPALPLLPSLQSLTLSFSALDDLPASLAALTSLTLLCLSDNQLTNAIEPLLPNLTALQDLDLSANRLTSMPNTVSRLTSLTRLKVADCSTWTLEPGLLAPLSNLKILDLGGDRMAELPPDTTSLHALHALCLRSVSLVALPPGVGALTALRSMDLYCNWLTDLPPSFSTLQSLTSLDLGHNFLEALPPALLALTSLCCLSLAYNRLSEVPEAFTTLSSLATLDLSFNPMRTIPPPLAACPSLDTLIAQGLIAAPPFALAAAPRLMALDLTADGLDLRWPASIPPADFQATVADPLLALASRTPRATVLADREFVVRLRQAWVRAGAQPAFPKLGQVAWDAVDLYEAIFT